MRYIVVGISRNILLSQIYMCVPFSMGVCVCRGLVQRALVEPSRDAQSVHKFYNMAALHQNMDPYWEFS
jgi:hypothetical protein